MDKVRQSQSQLLKRKSKSEVKLPRINDLGSLRQQSKQSKGESARIDLMERQVSRAVNLYNKKASSIVRSENMSSSRLLSIRNEALRQKLLSKKLLLKPSPVPSKQEPEPDPIPRQKINIELVNYELQEGAGSSRALPSSFLGQINNLITEQAQKLLITVRCHKQNQVGMLSAAWWCVVDSLFYSIAKAIKIRAPEVVKLQQESVTERVASKSKITRNLSKGGSPSKSILTATKNSSFKKQPNLQGSVESNTKVVLEFCKLYSCLEQQNRSNQNTCLRFHEDPNHIALILEAFFYEKAVIYLLASIRKWNHSQEILCIHSLASELIPCIMECRRLIVEILMQALESRERYNKVKKPKFIAKEKKLIQMSKYVSIIKEEYQAYLEVLRYTNRYKVFHYSKQIRDHDALLGLQQKWKNLVFDTPIPPFISNVEGRKELLLVIEPLNILYRYNKKQQAIQVDVYAEYFLNHLKYQFNIVFFTCVEKESSLMNFIADLRDVPLVAVLDKSYLTYSQARPIKDIGKLGDGYKRENLLVLDEKSNAKMYAGCHYAQILVDPNHAERKPAKNGPKAIKNQQGNESYLKGLAHRILEASKSGRWQDIVKQKGEKYKIQ